MLAAAALGVGKARIYQLIEEGRLQRFEIMGRLFVSCREVQEFAKVSRTAGTRYSTSAAA
jgi:hypothetical protein